MCPKPKTKLNTFLSVTAAVLILVLIFLLAQQLLRPKYMTDLVEGSMLSQYYREEKDHDVLFLGDCEIYSNISPMELWRHRGITAWARGSSQQMLCQSYYLLEETLRYETPKVVVFSVGAMKNAQPNEAYNRLTMDKLRWSSQKVNMILASMTEQEDFLSYVFPILRYHDRFDELTQEDLRYLFSEKDTVWNGYLLDTRIHPAGTLPAKRPQASYEFSPTNWEYLEKIRVLCQNQGIQLVLMKAPSLLPYWYEQYDQQIADYAAKHGLPYYNFIEKIDALGIDFQTDTYYGGLHLNAFGAAKLAQALADILAEEYGIPDHREDAVIAAVYNEKLKNFDEAKKGS